MAAAIIQRFAILSCKTKLGNSQRIVNLHILQRKTLTGQTLASVHKRFFHVTSLLLKNKLEGNRIITGNHVSRLQIKKKSRNRIIIDNEILKSNVSSVIARNCNCCRNKNKCNCIFLIKYVRIVSTFYLHSNFSISCVFL